jgi:hypothetical protein
MDHEEIMHILAEDDKDTKYQQTSTPAAVTSAQTPLQANLSSSEDVPKATSTTHA